MQVLTSNHNKKQRFVLGFFICLVAAFFYCYEFVLRILPGALQSDLVKAFGNISATTFGQLSALYYLAYSPMQLPVGMLMDRFGPRRLLTLACVCCALGSWMFSYTSSILIAGNGRFLVGFGSSFAFVGVLSLAMHWLPRRYFSFTAGLITMMAMLGLIYGEVQITSITIGMGWHYVLSLLTLIGVVLSIVIYIVIHDAPKEAVLARQTLSEFLSNVWAVLISPQVWLLGLVGALLYTSMSVFGELWGKSYLEHAHNLTKYESAKAISAIFFGWAVGAPLGGFISDISRRRLLPLVVGSVMSFICISIVLYWHGLSHTNLTCLLFLYGLFSGVEITVFIIAKENSRVQLSGTVFAAVNMIVSLVAVILQPLVGFLLDLFANHTAFGETIYTAESYTKALSILPVLLLLVIPLVLFIKNNEHQQA